MINQISIYTAGVLTIFMGIFHILFVKIFKWKDEYAKISILNRKIFHTIHLALLLLFFLFGALTIAYAKELSQPAGLTVSLDLVFAVFWLWRTLWQIFYFKGKTMHYLLIGIFLLLCISYLVPVLTSL